MQSSEHEWLDFLLDKRQHAQTCGGVEGAYYTPEQTQQINQSLAAVSDTAVRQHFHPQKFEERHIYPTNQWGNSDKYEGNIACLLEHIHAMQTFVAHAVTEKKGIFVYTYLQYLNPTTKESWLNRLSIVQQALTIALHGDPNRAPNFPTNVPRINGQWPCRRRCSAGGRGSGA